MINVGAISIVIILRKSMVIATLAKLHITVFFEVKGIVLIVLCDSLNKFLI